MTDLVARFGSKNLEHSLAALSSLKGFSFYGWRDAIVVDGNAETALQAQQIKYRLPAVLRPDVQINYQVIHRAKDEPPIFALTSGWNGTALSAKTASEATANKLRQGLSIIADVESESNLAQNIVIEPDMDRYQLIDNIAEIIPALGRIHDLRIDNNDDGLVVWGRVDSSRELGLVKTTIAKAGLTSQIENLLSVDRAQKLPEISIFRDNTQLIINGRLPNQRSRNSLIAAMQQQLDSTQIEDFISIEPDVAFSSWLDNWAMLLPVMPAYAFGLSVNGEGVLVTGPVKDQNEQESVMRAISAMFPSLEAQNWLTVNEDL